MNSPSDKCDFFCVVIIRSRRHFGTCPSEDDVGDISMSEDSMTETTTAAPQVRCLFLM